MSKIPEQILQAGCSAYCEKFLNGIGSLGDGIEAAYFAIHDHEDWVKAGPKAWDGEGLPPVGTVCEIRAHKLNDWSPATIKFASRNVIVWDWEAEPALNGLCTAYAHAVEIRQIRTPEQIAAEEREKTIAELKKVFDSISHELCQTSNKYLETLFGAIHDAGWKQVTP